MTVIVIWLTIVMTIAVKADDKYSYRCKANNNYDYDRKRQ